MSDDCADSIALTSWLFHRQEVEFLAFRRRIFEANTMCKQQVGWVFVVAV